MTSNRPNRDEYFTKMALLVAFRATCPRRAVGCVLVNSAGHVIATGYNGVARGTPHCEGEHRCGGSDSPSGQGLNKCKAIHAEQNALLQCSDVECIDTVYVTASPCITCAKLLLNTNCKRVVFFEEYSDISAKDLWESTGREWIHFKLKE